MSAQRFKLTLETSSSRPIQGLSRMLSVRGGSHAEESSTQATSSARNERIVSGAKRVYRQLNDADAPNVVWAIGLQVDSTADRHGFRIASMVDEHTRESLLDLAERSITGADLVTALKLIIAVRGTPVLIRCDIGPELISQALHECCEELIDQRRLDN